MRGSVTERMLWNFSLYQTNLADDILFVSLGTRNRGVFDTFGKTRRRGLELGLEGEAGKHYFRASYSRIDATFESPAEIVNTSNSTSTKEAGKVSTFLIQPGDRIPGIPRDSLRLAWRYRMTSGFHVRSLHGGQRLVVHAGQREQRSPARRHRFERCAHQRHASIPRSPSNPGAATSAKAAFPVTRSSIFSRATS